MPIVGRDKEEVILSGKCLALLWDKQRRGASEPSVQVCTYKVTSQGSMTYSRFAVEIWKLERLG
jgi:hypothetical protein